MSILSYLHVKLGAELLFLKVIFNLGTSGLSLGKAFPNFPTLSSVRSSISDHETYFLDGLSQKLYFPTFIISPTIL